MIHPDYLSSDWFDKGNKECVQLGDEVEIIGNIHENKELSEATND